VVTSHISGQITVGAYLAVVLDLYTRRVIGWATSSSPDAQLTVKALDMAMS
jgi:transposase InsO family protein